MIASRIGYSDRPRSVQTQLTDGERAYLAGKRFIADQSFKGHGPHPPCLRNAPEVVSEAKGFCELPPGQSGDERVGPTEARTRGVAGRRHRTGTAPQRLAPQNLPLCPFATTATATIVVQLVGSEAITPRWLRAVEAQPDLTVLETILRVEEAPPHHVVGSWLRRLDNS